MNKYDAQLLRDMRMIEESIRFQSITNLCNAQSITMLRQTLRNALDLVDRLTAEDCTRTASSHTDDDTLATNKMQTLADDCPHCGGYVTVRGDVACCQKCGRTARINR